MPETLNAVFLSPGAAIATGVKEDEVGKREIKRQERMIGTRNERKASGATRGEGIGISGSEKVPGKTPVRKSCQAGDSGLSVSRRERMEKDIRLHISKSS